MKKKKVIIVDLGIGNINSVKKAFLHLGAQVKISSSYSDFLEADAFILPGDGSFPYAMQSIQKLQHYPVLKEQVLVKNKLLLGICIGFQILFSSSTEKDLHSGLNWLQGDLVQFSPKISSVPHIGWAKTQFLEPNHPIFQGIPSETYFYYIHSYHLPFEPKSNTVLATSHYQKTFTSIVAKNNIYGVQFHPEKSDEPGLQLLQNFLNLI